MSTKLRFISNEDSALARQYDILISLVRRGHSNWQMGEIRHEEDGMGHFDVVSFSEDPTLSPTQLAPYLVANTTIDAVPVDVNPGEPVTTARQYTPTPAVAMMGTVKAGQSVTESVDSYLKSVAPELAPYL